MSRNQIQRSVLNVINIILKESFSIFDDISRENISSWNSLKHIEIMFAIEEEMGIQFSEDELAKLNSMNKIIDAVVSKYAA